jgi:hypothetical protein
MAGSASSAIAGELRRYADERRGLRRKSAAGRFVASDLGKSIQGIVPPRRRVVPMQFSRLFVLGDLVSSIAERQRTRESATADKPCFAPNRDRIGTVTKSLHESGHGCTLFLLRETQSSKALSKGASPKKLQPSLEAVCSLPNIGGTIAASRPIAVAKPPCQAELNSGTGHLAPTRTSTRCSCRSSTRRTKSLSCATPSTIRLDESGVPSSLGSARRTRM